MHVPVQSGLKPIIPVIGRQRPCVEWLMGASLLYGVKSLYFTLVHMNYKAITR